MNTDDATSGGPAPGTALARVLAALGPAEPEGPTEPEGPAEPEGPTEPEGPDVWSALEAVSELTEDERRALVPRLLARLAEAPRWPALALAVLAEPEAADALRDALPATRGAARAAVGVALWRCGAAGHGLHAAVSALRHEPDAGVREAIVRTLALAEDTAATTALLDALGDPEARVRRAAVEALYAPTGRTPPRAWLAAAGAAPLATPQLSDLRADLGLA